VKTDTILYQLFQTLPSILFELIGKPATEVEAYQFTSVEIKELAFRFDGLFVPASDIPEQPIYFVEVQFQPKKGTGNREQGTVFPIAVFGEPRGRDPDFYKWSVSGEV
jgi:predicted transposase YdaD